MTAAALYFRGWGWLLVPAVILLIIGPVLFGLAIGKRRGDDYGNVIDG